jgi:hypothetical protein
MQAWELLEVTSYLEEISIEPAKDKRMASGRAVVFVTLILKSYLKPDTSGLLNYKRQFLLTM